MIAPEALCHRVGESHHNLLAVLVEGRRAVGVDGCVQVGCTLQAVVGDGVVLIECTLLVEDLVAKLARELQREVEVTIAEGVVPTHVDGRQAIAQALAVGLEVIARIPFLGNPVAVGILHFDEHYAILRNAYRLKAPEVAQRVVDLHAVGWQRDGV